jgi:3-phenylpropionate/trans-cinnamate dioxygenase ferredoxin subunit
MIRAMNYRTWNENDLEYVDIGPVGSFTDGFRWLLDVDGLALALFHAGTGWFAVQDVCTHDGGPLGEGEVQGENVVCPRHGAKFSLSTGRAVGLPAVKDIDSYPVKVAENAIFVGLPKTRKTS